MSEKLVPIWIQKGPMPVFGNGIGENGSGSSSSGSLLSSIGKSSTLPKSQVSLDRSGTAILELRFQYPCQIHQITFQNYYTAWISIFGKRLNKNKSRVDLNASMKADNERSTQGKFDLCRPHLETLQFHGSSVMPIIASSVPSNLKEGDEEEVMSVMEMRQGDGIGQKQSLNLPSQNENDAQDLAWEVLIERKTLMPWPHHEGGSQDYVLVEARESLVAWTDIIILRIILHQPSTVWKTFSIHDVIASSHLTQNKGFSYFESLKDHSLSVLKTTTKAMLSGQIVEPENNGSEDDELTN